jgi:hypothetical protein
MYVRDCCLNAFRAFERVVMGVADRDVKKLAFGVLWNVRIGVDDLRSDLDAAPILEVSLKGCRNENAIMCDMCVELSMYQCARGVTRSVFEVDVGGNMSGRDVGFSPKLLPCRMNQKAKHDDSAYHMALESPDPSALYPS